MKILVTGAAGFLGSHLSEYLAKQGHEVYGIDNESIGLRSNVPSTIKYAKMDMRNTEDVASVLEECRPELIYHLAAWAHEGLSQFAPILITENNYNAFLNLIVPAIKYGMKRIVVCSSMSVYGSQTPPFSEELPRLPKDVYAVAKAAMEQTTEILSMVHDFQYTIVRLHNVYGPRQILHDPYRNVVGIFINRLLHDTPPIIYGDGNQTRAFSYIDDVTPYLAKAGLMDDLSSGIINLGAQEEYTINHLANTVLSLFGSNLTPLYFESRPQEIEHAFCTNEKAKKILGYETSVTLQQGIEKMVTWAKEQGPQVFKYLDELELEGPKIPLTWSQKLL